MWSLILIAHLCAPPAGAAKKINAMNFEDVEVNGKIHEPYDPRDGELDDEEVRRIPEFIFDRFEQLLLDIDPR